MSVTGKTLGVVLIGVLGLLAYVAVYSFSGAGFRVVAEAAGYVGVILTAVMLVIIMILAGGRDS